MAEATQERPKGETKQKIESKPMVENKAEAGAPKKRSKLWIMAGSAILIIIFGIVSFFAMPYIRGAHGDKAKTKALGAAEKKEIKATLSLEPFLVNLADPEESRFVKTTVQLGLAEEFKQKGDGASSVPAMRDSIITLLSTKTSDQILTAEGKVKLREEIKARVNKISPQIKVVEVYIVDFVVQL